MCKALGPIVPSMKKERERGKVREREREGKERRKEGGREGGGGDGRRKEAISFIYCW
jgi:hypothetical protein